MSRCRLRALVLTAGHGNRLRPLTLFLPKPLVPVAGEPVVGHTLRQLGAAGCEGAILNLHHLPQAIPTQLGRSYFGLPIDYSYEPEIQGTLGALYPPLAFLREADVALVVNGDSLCRWPLRALVRRHLRSGADATLLLLSRSPDPSLGGGIGVDGRGRVVRLRDLEPVAAVARRHIFAGVHLLSRRVLERIEAGPGDIIEGLYQPLLQQGGNIQTVVTRRRWHDLGTPERYLDACLDQIRGRLPLGRSGTGRVSPLAEVAVDAQIRGSIVELGAVVEAGAVIEDSVVLTGARIGAGSRLHRTIVGPDVRFPAASEARRRMINRLDKRHQVAESESVMGSLVYTPL